MWMFQLPAYACGGLFCATTPAQPLPVVQNAERIAFGIDDGFVEAHVQVFYEGPPDAFAWVVPVPSDVEVFVSHDALFDVLDANLAPLFRTDTRNEGNCTPRRMNLGCASESSLNASVDVAPDVQAPAVTVTSEGQIGPYDYVVLDAASEGALLDFLDDEGFDFDPSMAEALAPYVIEGSSFLAFRLSKDRSTGDIQPIGFRYPGDTASVPIQLTRIAAAADMAIQVNVFGAERALSTNYLHVDLDPVGIDWVLGGVNYFDQVARGVDEAGGHAFVTEYAGPTGQLRDTLWSAQQEALAAQALATTDFLTLEDIVYAMELPPDPSVTRATGAVVGPEEVAAIQQELAVYFDQLRTLQALVDLPQVTRLSTTLDPAEMTLDPQIVLHPSAPIVERVRTRELIRHCEGRRPRNSITEALYADGRAYRGIDNRDRVDQAALKISGWDGEELAVIYDGLPDLLAESDPEVRGACGCAGNSWSAGLLTLLLGLVGLRRR